MRRRVDAAHHEALDFPFVRTTTNREMRGTCEDTALPGEAEGEPGAVTAKLIAWSSW
jgi:hypothetical protein